jgi:hypothetical protein
MNKMIAELALMPPPQLAQYAAANQNDTMKFLAAKAASDLQKKQMMMNAAQQQPAAPPVADQVVHQMAQGLPEDSGIGALPTPNMRGYAAGGIVAFADGGFNDALAAVNASMPDPRVDPSGFNRFGGSMTDYLNARQKAMQAIEYNLTPESPESSQAYASTYGTNYRSGPQLRRAEPSKGTPKAKNVATMPTDDTRRTDSRFPSGVAALTPVSAPVGQRGTPTPTGANLAPSAGAMSIADLQKAQASVMPKGPVADPYAAERAQSAAELNAVNEEGVVNAQAQKEGLAGLRAPREQRIKAREDRLKYTDDQNLNMSLINAGLAMMQSRGQGLAGIAEGAGVGVKQYSEGLKLSEAARQKIEDAKDAFDELMFNQTNMTNKAVTDAKRTVAEGAIAMRNAGIASSEKATGLAHDDAKALFSNYVQSREAGLDRASRERTAAFSAQVQKEIASMPGAQEKLFATLGGGDAKKGFAYFTKETNEGRGDQALLKAYIANPAMMDFLDPDTKKAFQMMLKAQIGMVSGAPNAGQVRAP